MATHIEVIAASQGLLPPPCPTCLWWQGTGGDRQVGAEGRLEWIRTMERRWGSVGLVALDGTETVAAVQFAPVSSLLRVHRLPVGPPPLDGVLLHCLRGRVGRPVRETQQLLHVALLRLRERGIEEAWAYARPLGGKDICGVRNIFGLEFLEANGFHTTAVADDAHLMHVSLSGLVPDLAGLAEAGAALARGLISAGHPRPAPSPR